MGTNLTIFVETRQAKGTSALAMDFKDRLKSWADISFVHDHVDEDTRRILYEADLSGPVSLETLMTDVFDPFASFVNTVNMRAETRTCRRDYKASRRERKLTADQLGVTHLRHKGDPYIETD